MAVELATALVLGSLITAGVLIFIVAALREDHPALRAFLILFVFLVLFFNSNFMRIGTHLYFNQTIVDSPPPVNETLGEIRNLNALQNSVDSYYKYAAILIGLVAFYVLGYMIYSYVKKGEEVAEAEEGGEEH